MRQESLRGAVVGFGLLGLAFAAGGCATSSETAGKQTLTADVGRYSPPPAGIDRPRTGVPPFETTGAGSSKELNGIAADQLTTLAVNSERFDVIERAQLEQLLREQGLEGIVKPDELAQSGKVRGVDFLLIGKVSNLRVKAEAAKRGFGLANLHLPGGGALGAFDFQRKDSTIKAECGVDLRLVDATSGQVAAAQHSDYTRTDSIGAFGVTILGVGAQADADLQIDEDNKGLILRLALDDAIREMLPKIDRFLLARGREKKASAAATSPPAETTTPAGAAPAAPPAAVPAGASGEEIKTAPGAEVAKKFCGNCGGQLAAGAKFCPGCGNKVE